jgi:L-iditol 2-dehydrogenase
MLAKMAGASQVLVTDLVDYRLKKGKRLGADVTINPQKENLQNVVKQATEGRGADIAIVTAPNAKAVEDSIQIIRKGGKLLLFAPTQPDQYARLSPHRLFFSEITVVPSYSVSHVETRQALELISSGKLKAKELITHRFALSQTREAFQTAAKSKECLKVVVVNQETS